MDPAEDMERLGIPAFEIDGNDRETGFLDQLDDILRPWNVLHDLSLAQRDLVLPLLPGTYLASREQAQGMLVRDMPQRGSDAGNAPRPACGEVVDRNEAVPEIRNKRKKEGRQDLVVRPAGADHGIQDHPVDGTVMVVGYSNEASFLGNALQLLRRDFIADADIFDDMVREFGAIGIVEFVVNAVHLLQFQQTVSQPGHHTPRKTLDTQDFLQFIDFQDGRFGLRFGFSRWFFHRKVFKDKK